MSDMIERVARALAESDGSCWDGIIGGRKISRDKYRSLAREAIEAMREPTGAMLTAMRVNLGGTDELHIDEAEEAWGKGIDAALNEKSPATS